MEGNENPGRMQRFYKDGWVRATALNGVEAETGRPK